MRAGQLRLTLRNEGERSAPMAVYGYDGSTEAPVHLDVERRERIGLTPGGPAYDVIVTGPNRFRRDFAGSLPGAALDVGSEAAGYARRLRVTLTNRGRGLLDVSVAPLAYGGRVRRLRVRAGAERVVSWETADGWYDVEVTVAQDPAYRRRLTGHLENGRPSVSG